MSRCLLVLTVALIAQAQPPSSILLTTSANPATFGQPVTLTASIPSATTGAVAFYDGPNLLAIQPVTAGQASVTTRQLAAGPHPIRAAFNSVTSASLLQTITTHPLTAFRGPDHDPAAANTLLFAGCAANTLIPIVIADFNEDGLPDIVSADSLQLANADGTHRTLPPPALGRVPRCLVAGDFNLDGHADLAVTNPADNTVTVLLGHGDATFDSPVTYPVGEAPIDVLIGDFNLDGRPDLVVANQYSATISVLLGNGDGTFRKAIDYPTGSAPTLIVSADFNNDGVPDLALNSLQEPFIRILLGNPDGSFQPPVSYQAAARPTGLALGDFNGDGQPDLVVAGSLGSISLHLGNPDGTFQPLQILPFKGFGSIAVADFNADGIPDLAIGGDFILSGGILAPTVITLTSTANPSQYSIYPSIIATVDPPQATGTVTFYGLADVPIVNGQATLTPFLEIGKHTLSAFYHGDSNYASSTSAPLVQTVIPTITTTQLTSSANPSPAGRLLTLTATVSPSGNSSVAFFNGKILLGTSTPDQGIATLVVRLSPGDYALTAVVTGNQDYSSSTSPVLNQSVAGDLAPTATTLLAPNPSPYGRPLALSATVSPPAATGSVTFYDGTTVLGTGTLSDGQAHFSTLPPTAGLRTLRAIYSGAIGYDTSISPPLPVSIAAAPSNSFAPPLTTPVDIAQAPVVADLNLDGIPDLLTIGSNTVDVRLGNGDGTFQPVVSLYVLRAGFILVADFDGDGFPDLAVMTSSRADPFSGAILILLGSGDGNFRFAANFPAGFGPTAVADLDNDGIPDLVAVNAIGQISTFLGNGDGTFRVAQSSYLQFPQVGLVSSIAVADLNGDGIPDVAETGAKSFILLGNGDGTFKTTTLANPPATSIAIEDFNRDGIPDLAFGGDTGIQLRLGNGDGTFQPPAGIGPVSSTLLTADFNADGIPDLVTLTAGQITIYPGKGDGTFQPSQTYSGGVNATALAITDLNHDSRPDLVVAASDTPNLTILLGSVTPQPPK